jgi:hypothetical protein
MGVMNFHLPERKIRWHTRIGAMYENRRPSSVNLRIFPDQGMIMMIINPFRNKQIVHQTSWKLLPPRQPPCEQQFLGIPGG